MITKSKLKTSRNIIFLLVVFLIACGGGSSSNPPESVESAEIPANQISNSLVNGFRVSRSTSFDEFDTVTRTEEYTYDDETNTVNIVTTTINEPQSPNSIRTSSLSYDEIGNPVQRDNFRTGEITATSTFRFDSDNLLLSSSFEDFDPFDAGLLQLIESTYSYNGAGQLIRRVEVDVFAAAEVGDSYEPTTSDFTYDTNGNRLSRTVSSTFYFDGILESRGFNETQYTVNDSGQIVRREQTFDGDSAPTIDMYSYDGNGNMFQVISSFSDTFFVRDVFEYEAISEPVYNEWIRLIRFIL